MSYIELLLDLAADGANRTIAGSVRTAPDEQMPANAFVLKVIRDAANRVVLVACRSGGGYEVIGVAAWAAPRLRDLQRRADRAVPTEYQWDLVEKALAANADVRGSADIVDAHALARSFQRRDKLELVAQPSDGSLQRRRRLWNLRQPLFGLAMLGIAVAFMTLYFLVFAEEEPAPASQTPAAAVARPVETVERRASREMRWADVETPNTSLGLVLKDWQAEQGKRMCVEGTIASIERRDLDRRKVYDGTLVTEHRDEVSFVAVGTTGELVRGSSAKLCGVVIGRLRVVGMFDLPENRQPIVEH